MPRAPAAPGRREPERAAPRAARARPARPSGGQPGNLGAGTSPGPGNIGIGTGAAANPGVPAGPNQPLGNLGAAPGALGGATTLPGIGPSISPNPGLNSPLAGEPTRTPNTAPRVPNQRAPGAPNQAPQSASPTPRYPVAGTGTPIPGTPR